MDDFTMKPLHPDYLKVILEVMLSKGREKVAKAILAEKELEMAKNVASKDSVASAPAITIESEDNDGSLSTSVYSRGSLQTGKMSMSRMSSASSKSVHFNSAGLSTAGLDQISPSWHSSMSDLSSNR